jgi:hypothetical protein
MSDLYIPRGDARRLVARSVWFNIDNGSGVTIDDVILVSAQPIKIVSARIIYVDATTGTVAAGTAGIGTTVAGVELVAATAYENTKAVGTYTAMTLKAAAAFVAALTPIIVRHTGIAVTAAGQAVVEIEYIVLS